MLECDILLSLADFSELSREYILAFPLHKVKLRYSSAVFYRSLWQTIEGGAKSKYGIVGKFSSQTSVGTMRGWRYIGARYVGC